MTYMFLTTWYMDPILLDMEHKGEDDDDDDIVEKCLCCASGSP
jgi:hypothetical protein